MKPALIAGIVLIVIGVVGLSAGSISFTTKEKVVDIGTIDITADEKHVIGIPQIAGIGALIAGVVLCVAATRRT